jgi:hypothetical protein
MTGGTIYGLMSTRDSTIRYVGKTDRDPWRRYQEHYWNEKAQERPVYNWIANERWFGYDLDYAVLAKCALSELDYMEAWWIARVPNLLNVRLTRKRRVVVLDPMVARQLTAIRKRKYIFVYNWNGWIGIRYRPDVEAWQVHVQVPGRRFEILKGDGGTVFQAQETYPGPFGRPMYRGDWYFSELKAAIDARHRKRNEWDEFRRGWGAAGYAWPRDILP